MPTRKHPTVGAGLSTDEATRALLLLMPRLVGRAKRIPVPEQLSGLSLAPRHLSMLSYLLLDGPMTVNELAEQLEVAPTTVSLMVGDLSRLGILDRQEDEADRRRRIVSIAPGYRQSVGVWLGRGAVAWEQVLTPLTADQRRTVVDTLRAYEQAVTTRLR